jgi:hypothetical protein
MLLVCINISIRLLSPDTADAKCQYHARGDDRDIIDFFCETGEGSIKLNGDNTKIRDSRGLTDQQKQAAVDYVNQVRIIADHRTELYKKSIQ